MGKYEKVKCVFLCWYPLQNVAQNYNNSYTNVRQMLTFPYKSKLILFLDPIITWASKETMVAKLVA